MLSKFCAFSVKVFLVIMWLKMDGRFLALVFHIIAEAEIRIHEYGNCRGHSHRNMEEESFSHVKAGSRVEQLVSD